MFVVAYVVVQFYPWFNFYFILFFSMLIYDNEYQTKENQNRTKDKIELPHMYVCHVMPDQFFHNVIIRLFCLLFLD